MTEESSGARPASDDTEAVVDLLGALAYAQLSGFGQLAADAQMAPALSDKAAVARMAVVVFGHHESVSERLASLGVTPEAAMAPFVSAIDAFHERTRPSDWLEGLVKAYVGDGIARDFYSEAATYLDDDSRAFVARLLADEGQAEFITATVRESIVADERLGGRLALWARRIMGEAVQQAQSVTSERDSLTTLLVGGAHGADIAELGRMFARINDAHTARMKRLGLTA
jgi:hypothetical protein